MLSILLITISFSTSYAGYTFSMTGIDYEDCGTLSIPYESTAWNYYCHNPISGACITQIEISFELRDGVNPPIPLDDDFNKSFTTLHTKYGSDESGTHYLDLSSNTIPPSAMTNYELVAILDWAFGIDEPGGFAATILCYTGSFANIGTGPAICEQSLGTFTYTPQSLTFSWQQDYNMVYNTQTQTWENQKTLSGTFTNTSTTNGGVSYFWESNDGSFSSAGTSGAITFPNCTVYNLGIESTVSGCKATSTQTIDLSDAAQCGQGRGGNNSNRIGNNESLQLIVDPLSGVNGNPLLIKYDSFNERDISVKIIGLDGKIIWQNNVRSSQGMNHLKIPTYSFSKGMYLIQLTNQQDILTKKWMIQ